MRREKIIDCTETDTYAGIGVYSIENCNNGKIYIGSSKNIKSRVRQHECLFYYRHCNNRILLDINKGHTFKSHILYKFSPPCKESELRLKEREMIHKLDSFINGYNINPDTKYIKQIERVF